jgi:hypothetical protein
MTKNTTEDLRSVTVQCAVSNKAAQLHPAPSSSKEASPQLNKCSFSSYPLKAKYVELMGKEKGYNSSHVYCQVKRWFKKS